jgi:hypothetical protein
VEFSAEWIAAIASVATVVVTAIMVIAIWFQLKQVSRTINGNTAQTLASNAITINTLLIQNPKLGRIFDDSKTMDDLDIGQTWMILTIFNYYETVFFQYEKGTLSPELWNSTKQVMKEVLKNEKFKQKWDELKGQFYVKFREAVEADVLE